MRRDWTAIGIRFFSWASAIALVLAAVYLLPAGADHPWLRVIAGLAAGAALAWFAPLIDAAGIGILYVTVYAAYARLGLVPLAVAFIALLGVTALAVWLATKRDSKFIAIVGMLGGFVTAYLLSAPANYPLGVFAFLLAIDLGMAWLAAKRGWWLLLAIATVMTAIYEWAWTLLALDYGLLPIAAAIFALFAIVASVPLWWPAAAPRHSRIIAAAAAHLPLLFAIYVATRVSYGPRFNVLFAFLFIVDAGLLAIVWRTSGGWPLAVGRWPSTHAAPVGQRSTANGQLRWLHAASGIATLLVFIIWFRVSFTHAAWPALLVWAAAFIALYLWRVSIFAGLLFAIFIGLGVHETAQWAPTVLLMFVMLGVVFYVATKFGRPLVAAVAVALACIALMTFHPPLWTLVALHVILFAEIFVIAWISGYHVLAILALPFLVAMVATSYSPAAWGQYSGWTLLAIAALPYLLFVAYAFLRPEMPVLVAAALASLFLFIVAWREYAGWVAVAITLLMVVLFVRVMKREPREPHLTLIIALAFAFSDVAAALLLPRPWAVVYFALGAAFLIWLFGRFRHPLLPVWAAGLGAVVFLWLAFDGDLFVRWWVYVICGLAMFAAAYLIRLDLPVLQRAFSVAGLFELWFLINILIANCFHSANGAISFDFAVSQAAENVWYTVAWAVIATGLLILGFLIHWPAARGAALALLIAAVLKAFLFDLWNLHGTPLAVSLLGLGASVAVVGFVLQRFRAPAPARA